jgi:hypothetical protein
MLPETLNSYVTTVRNTVEILPRYINSLKVKPLEASQMETLGSRNFKTEKQSNTKSSSSSSSSSPSHNDNLDGNSFPSGIITPYILIDAYGIPDTIGNYSASQGVFRLFHFIPYYTDAS